MKKLRLELAVLFLVSLAFRILFFIFVAVPAGDAAQFASFVREISEAGGNIPAVNTIYFPGSPYIYPPLLFLVAYWISIPFSSFVAVGGIFYMDTLLSIAAIFSSMTACVIYALLPETNRRDERMIRFIVLAFLSPDLFVLTFGGFPSIVSVFFLVVMIFSLSRRNEGLKWKLIPPLAIIMVGLSHDLTYFLAIYLMLVFTFYDYFMRRSLFRQDLVTLLGGFVVGVAWWLPRIGFLLSAIFTSQSQGVGIFSQSSDILPSAIGIMPSFLALLVISLSQYFHSKVFRDNYRLSYFEVSALASILGIPFIILNPAVSARFVIYFILFALVAALASLGILWKPRDKRDRGKVVTVVLALLLVLIPAQIVATENSLGFYSSGTFQYDQQLITWGKGNITNGTVVAPSSIGEYLCAIDGLKVITYTGYFVGSNEVAQRNAAAEIVINSTSNQSLGYISRYSVSYVIVQKDLLGQKIDGHTIKFPSPLYSLVKTTQYYEVFIVR